MGAPRSFSPLRRWLRAERRREYDEAIVQELGATVLCRIVGACTDSDDGRRVIYSLTSRGGVTYEAIVCAVHSPLVPLLDFRDWTARPAPRWERCCGGDPRPVGGAWPPASRWA